MARFEAPMFAADTETPVQVRFSTMNGGPAGRDIGPNNLGLAVRFGADGGDLVAVNAALFPAKDPTASFKHSSAMSSPRRPVAKPPVIEFLRNHTGSIAATIAYGRSRARGRPPSFAETTYHGQHTFWLASTSNDKTLVRYRWAPTAGDRGGRSWGDPASTLRDELIERLAAGPVQFTLMLEVAGYRQHADDPSEFWPETLERLIAGELTVRPADTPMPARPDPAFRPSKPPAGWEPDDADHIMNARREVYALARARRRKTGRLMTSPVDSGRVVTMRQPSVSRRMVAGATRTRTGRPAVRARACRGWPRLGRAARRSGSRLHGAEVRP